MTSQVKNADDGMGAALQAIREGRSSRALEILNALDRPQADVPLACFLRGIALQGLGQLQPAELELRKAVAGARDLAHFHGALADVLERRGALNEAEGEYRTALELDPSMTPAAVGLARVVLHQGCALEALEVLQSRTDGAQAGADVLLVYAAACRECLRRDAAIAAYERLARFPGMSDVAVIEIAATLVELEDFAAAVELVRTTSGLGGSPEAKIVLARGLRGMGRYEEADAAYADVQVLPVSQVARQEQAELSWMRSGDLASAVACLARGAGSDDLLELDLCKARLLEMGGEIEQAFETMEAVAVSTDRADVHLAAARLARRAGRSDAASLHLQVAVGAATRTRTDQLIQCEALLASSRFGEASALASELHRRAPTDNRALALLATTWRLQRDERYSKLFDYGRLVSDSRIETPEGWNSLEAFLADLAGHLRGIQDLVAPPLDQSVRGGVQSLQSLARSEAPVMRAFFTAVDAPIRAHIDAVLRQTRSDYRIGEAWSVRLRAGGAHTSHIHPRGWLSTAFYVDLPRSGGGSEGCLALGEPGVDLEVPLPAEHLVRPEAGRLVIFPSYMWHGTTPFRAEGERLTVAFDILPPEDAEGDWRNRLIRSAQ